MPRRSSRVRPAPRSALAAPNPPQPVGHAPPFLKKASGKKIMMKKNFAVIKEEIGARAKKNISKASSTGKVVADISDSLRHQTTRKKQNAKLTAVNEEVFHEEDIEDGGFLHDHRKCMEAQHDDIDMDYFLSRITKELPSIERPETPPPSPPLNPPSPPRFLEILGEPILDGSTQKF